MEFIEGGVCAAKGFTASGVHCGIRKNHTKKDLSLIVSEKPASAAAVYTKNQIKGAPLLVTRRHLDENGGFARGIICNSGNANTCNAGGESVAEEICGAAASCLGVRKNEILVASTGVIGQKLDAAPMIHALPGLVRDLGNNSADAAAGIMTTDTVIKEAAVSFHIGGATCRLGGIAKGSGMICPNMATMLAFLTTDAAITPALLQKALAKDVRDSFNMVSVDGDTSTNDMVVVLANGRAGNAEIREENEDFFAFQSALSAVTKTLSRMIAKDGEGATKLMECNVSGAADVVSAKKIAKAVINSPLVKTAVFGADANWGRVLCAMGYSGGEIDAAAIKVSFVSRKGEVTVCENGTGIPFSEEKAKEILSQDEIAINITQNAGDGRATAWGCDLTYDYVRINGDYRT